MKFGGTSVANMSRIRNVVKIIAKEVKSSHNKLIVVVSAMSGVTNKLIDDYKKINLNISNPEYDVILSTGEQHSASIVSTMLNQKKIYSGIVSYM